MSWSVSAEFAAYLLFPALLRLVGHDFWSGLATIVAIVAAMTLWAELWLRTGLTELTHLALLCVYAVAALYVGADERDKPTVAARLHRWSDLTYSSYMLHAVPATVILSGVLPRLLGRGPVAVSCAIAAALSATAAMSVVSYRYPEAPARRTLNRLGAPV